MSKRIVIVGGGITGLAAACFLEERADVNVVLVEASDRFGGEILTVVDSDFIIEAGPDSFLAVRPWVVDLIRKLGLETDLISPINSRYYILIDGKLHMVPDGFVSMVPTNFFAFLRSDLFTTKGKIRLALEPFVRRKRDSEDESIESFFGRRMGKEISERLAEPLFAGIYASAADQLSVLATFPQFREMEMKYGSVTRAVLCQNREQRNRGGSAFLSLQRGMGSLVEAIASHLSKTKLSKNRKAKNIIQKSSAYKVELEQGESIETDCVILAVPSFCAAEILEDLDQQIATLLRRIPYASTAVVTLVFKRADVDHPLNGTGFVVTRNKTNEMTACTWTSSKWGGRAPSDYVLLRCFFGAFHNEHVLTLDDSSLVNLASRELEPILGLRASAIKRWVFRWNRATPQYLVGHLKTLDRIKNHLEKYPRIFVIGSAFEGIGLPDCVRQAKQAADRI